MQKVSQTWKNEQQKTLISAEAFVEISLNIGDPEAQTSATVSITAPPVVSFTIPPNASFNAPQDIIKRTAKPIKYATCENNLWLLDGTFRILGAPLELPEDVGNGFIPLGAERALITADGEEFWVRG